MIKTFVLAEPPHPARENCKKAIDAAPVGFVVRISEPRRSLEQNDKMHAMIGDIADQYMFCGRKWDAEDMKRLCIDQFRRDTINDPDFKELWAEVSKIELAPSLDGSGTVALGVQSRRFPKKLAIAFIEWLYCFGAEHGVVWSDPMERAA